MPMFSSSNQYKRIQTIVIIPVAIKHLVITLKYVMYVDIL